jgi:hypothetical protein
VDFEKCLPSAPFTAESVQASDGTLRIRKFTWVERLIPFAFFLLYAAKIIHALSSR